MKCNIVIYCASPHSMSNSNISCIASFYVESCITASENKMRTRTKVATFNETSRAYYRVTVICGGGGGGGGGQ